jgi:ssDNA-binding Zn-finger/Zn-ribbon topoisomerase 1
MDTVVYVGAGLDVRPIRVLPNVKKFIYIDSLPATEQYGFDKKYSQYKPNFVNDFNRKMERLDFDWNFKYPRGKYIKPFKAVYKKDDDTEVCYYMNASFPEQITEEIKKDVEEANILVVAGHHPHESVLDMMKSPEKIMCWEGTWYGNEEYDDCEKSVIRQLYTQPQKGIKLQYYKKVYECHDFDTIAEIEAFRVNKN